MVSYSPIKGRIDSGTRRLIIARNRGPIEHYDAADGKIRHRQAGGGVAVALRGVAQNKPLSWLAAACGPADEAVAQLRPEVSIGPDSTLRLLPIPRCDGSLVLSMTVGSFRELESGAFGIDPVDVAGTASALAEALDLGPEDRKVRTCRIRAAIERHQLSDWLRSQLKDLELVAHERASLFR